MTNNNFEKRIKDKLNQYEVNPSENLLESIFEKRNAKYKAVLKFSYVKLGIAMLGLAILSVIAMLNWPSSVQEQAGVSSVNLKESVAPDKKGTSNENQSSGQSVANNTNTSSKDENVSPSENAAVKDATDGNVKNTANHVDKGISFSHATVKKQYINRSNQTDKNISKSADRNVKSNVVSSSIVKSGKSTGKSIAYNDNGTNIEERYFNVDADNRPLIAETHHQGQSHLMVYHSVENERLDNLELNYLFMKPMRRMPANKQEAEYVALINYKSLTRALTNRKPVFVDVLFSPYMSYHNVIGNQGMKSSYNSMAQPSMNKQYNIRVSYPLTSNINIFSGVGYMNLSTNFKGSFEISKDAVRYEKVTNYINDPILGTIPVSHIDTINYTNTQKQSYNFKNSYQILNIPLGLSYNFGVKDFDFAVHGAAVFNIMTGAKGTNADFANYQTTSFSSAKKYVGVGGGLSFMVAYKINNRIRLIAEPGLQYFKINSNKNGNVVNEKVLNNGLSLGLRYTLF